MIVDHQTHWIPTEAFRLLGSRAAKVRDRWHVEISPGVERSYGPEFYDLDSHMLDLDRHQIDAMLSSPGSAGDVTRMPSAQAIELAEVYNSEASRAQRELAGRFFGLAVLPLQDPDAALRMLETAIVDQGLAGVCVPANVNELSLVSRELIPIYARLAELQRPLVIHPTNRTMLASRHGGLPPEFERIGWMFDTSAASLALIYSGALDAAPGLTVLHPHLGGTLPFLAARMHAVEGQRGGDDEKPQRSIFDYFKENFYVDTVSGTPGSIEMAMNLYGPSKVVFGSDYPWLPRQAALDDIQEQLGDQRAASVTRTVLANLL